MEKDTVKTIMKMVVATVLLCFVLAKLSTILGLLGSLLGLLAPFWIGACIAFILNVLLKVWEEKVLKNVKLVKNGKRVLSILLTFLSVGLILFLVVWLVVPQLIEAGESIGDRLPAAIERAQNFLDENMREDTQLGALIAQFGANSEKMIEEMTAYLRSSSGNILSTTVNVVSGTFGMMVNFFMGLIFAIYILAQKERLRGQMRQVMHAFLPDRVSLKLFQIGRLTEETFQKFITGQCLEAVIFGSIFLIVMSLLRMPYALPISVMLMFCALIPVFGSFVGCILSTILILVVNPIQAVGFLVLFIVIQQIEGNLIYPHVVGNSVGLPSIWVFAAVLIGGKLFGIVGMLVCIPLCSVIYVLFRDEVKKRLNKKENKGRET